MRDIKYRLLSVLVATALIFAATPMNVFALAAPTVWDGSCNTDFQGSGTENDPYIISSAEELAGLAENVNSGNGYAGKHLKLTNDILLNDGGERFGGNTVGKNSWIPIGNANAVFSGTFDGDGHTVSGIYINNANQYQGLFGYIAYATVKNLGIKKSYISGEIYVGSIAGYIDNSKITDCHSECNLNNSGYYYAYVGGIAGYIDNSKITDCHSECNLNDSGYYYAYVGGIVGYNEKGTVSECYNIGNISGKRIGGIIGNNNGNVTKCYNAGNICAIGNAGFFAGGIIGYHESGNVTECYNTGEIKCDISVSGIFDVGGIIGFANFGSVSKCYNEGKIIGTVDDCCDGNLELRLGGVVGFTDKVSVLNCYNTGDIDITVCCDTENILCFGIGGVVGWNWHGPEWNIYNTGGIVLTSKDTDFTNVYIGGCIGLTDYRIDFSYYLDTCIDNTANTYGKALTDAKMRQKLSYENWDFDKVWDIKENINSGYPILRCFKYGILPGDINWDSKINATDLALLKSEILSNADYDENFDVNNDETVNILDLINLKRHIADNISLTV